MSNFAYNSINFFASKCNVAVNVPYSIKSITKKALCSDRESNFIESLKKWFLTLKKLFCQCTPFMASSSAKRLNRWKFAGLPPPLCLPAAVKAFCHLTWIAVCHVPSRGVVPVPIVEWRWEGHVLRFAYLLPNADGNRGVEAFDTVWICYRDEWVYGTEAINN